MCQIQGIHPSPRQSSTAVAAVLSGWIGLTQKGFCDVDEIYIRVPLQ